MYNIKERETSRSVSVYLMTKVNENEAGNDMSSIIVSVATSMFTVNMLYTISEQKQLWIAIFLVLELFVLVLQRVIAKCCYTRAEENDIDKMTLYRITVIIHLTITFIIIKLVMDIFSFLIAITYMESFDYINIGAVVLSFVMVILVHLKF